MIIPLTFFTCESPKFLLSKSGKRDTEAYVVIYKLLPNDKKHLLNEEVKRKISKQYYSYMKLDEKRSKFKDLFNYENLTTSLILFVLWYIVSYIYYGSIYILPNIYKNLTLTENKTKIVNEKLYDQIVFDIIFSCFFEIPGNILSGILPNSIGRKQTIIFGFLLSSIFSILCIFSTFAVPIYSSFVKSLVNVSFIVLYIFTSENYPTYMRVTAMGTCNFFSRLGGFTTPLINELLYEIHVYLPFVGFTLTSLLGLFLTLKLTDTQHKSTF